MTKNTKLKLVVLATLLIGWSARADEGMWLPSLISQRIADMQEKGFRLDAEDIYSINEASLKDAVVLFGRGCTGELISPEGLLLTNHHCGYSQIQQHSSVEHDYLRDGFWAMSREEELPNKGLSVSFLERMEDVTDLILNGYTPDMTEDERIAIVKKNSKTLIAEATKEGNGLRASASSVETPTTGCGHAIQVTSRCSESMRTRTTTLPHTRRTMSHTSLRNTSESLLQACRRAISPSSTASLDAPRSISTQKA